MKKISLTTILSFIFLALSSICAYLLRYAGGSAWQMLGIGVGILVISGLVAAIFGRINQQSNKKIKIIINMICYILSAIALGFCIRCWYIYRGFDNSILIMLLISFLCVWYLWIYYALSKLPVFDKHPILFMIIFIVLSITIYVIVIATTKTTFVSTFGYYMIIEIAFIFAMLADATTIQEFIRNITLSTYSVFVVAIIIAIILLAGDGADLDFDFAIDGLDFSTGKKKNKPDDRLTM